MMKQRKGRADDSPIVRAQEISIAPRFDQHQAPTDRLKLYVRTVIESEA